MVQRWLKPIIYTLWSVLLTAGTFFLGAPPLKLLRAKVGRAVYWMIGAAIALGFFGLGFQAMSAAFFSLVVLIGVFSEFEDMEFGVLASSAFSVLITSLLAASSFAIWVARTPKWNGVLLNFVETVLKPVGGMGPRFQVNPYDVLVQLPSIVLILWLGSLYMTVLLEPRLRGSDEPSARALSSRLQLAELRLPDPVIWVFIASLLGAFSGLAPHWLEAVAVNAMNVTLLLLFFQGIAVVARFFVTARLGLFWQFLFMVLIVVHLFLFVSLLGLVDYWVDFRARLAKRAETFNREV